MSPSRTARHPRGIGPSTRVHEVRVMPRKPEPHKPLAVERPSEILEGLDPALVDLDELVEHAHHHGNPLLSSKGRQRDARATRVTHEMNG